jgi:hypothetical protein
MAARTVERPVADRTSMGAGSRATSKRWGRVLWRTCGAAAIGRTLVLLLLQVPQLAAQQPREDEATRLAKTTQNPVSSLISLPFQLNFNSGGGLGGQTSFTLNFQPVIPVNGLLPRWNIIARTIIPYLSLPAGVGRESGLGDIEEQLFFTPVKSGAVTWGVGPVLSFPTATADAAATGSWALGPVGLVLKSSGPWVFGALINNIWTLADQGGDPEVNQFLLQPFVNYNFGKGWALGVAPNITANWDAPDGEEWTVPLGAGISKTTAFNGRPMSLGAQYYHNIEHPAAGAANLFRISISLLYPPHAKPKSTALPD